MLPEVQAPVGSGSKIASMAIFAALVIGLSLYGTGWFWTARLLLRRDREEFPSLPDDYLGAAMFAVFWPVMLTWFGLEALLKLTYRGIE